jgi:glycine cleavage system H protein
MNEIWYTEDHEWVRLNDDGSATIGITDYAQAQLGDIVFVELPEVGTEVAQGEEIAVIESVKAAGEVKMPVSGVVVEVNTALNDAPEKINESPLDDGWILRAEPGDPEQLQDLMDEEAYMEFIGTL